VLPGFSYLRILGSGGFADVFLYEQNMPRRQVAVKVMLSEIVDDHVRQMFQAEANLMSQLSAHPAILTVYEANVSSDGRPYLVMELCSAQLADRYRREPLPVAEVLAIAVKIGSAIETAHRAGVLHRDIKPSNILTTAYGHPVLSDFGIASTIARAREEESVGLSIPWSAPEVLLDESPGSIASEVWSFAATVYSLLAGRSPFELVGGDNGASELIGRITRGRAQPIGRPDVPASLEAALRSAMVRKPEQRPASVLEVVRALQAVEAELGLPQTQVELAREEWTLGGGSGAEDRTRLRPVSVGSSGSRAARRRAARGLDWEAAPADTGAAPRSSSRTGALGRGQQALTWALVSAAVLAIGLGVIALVVLVSAATANGIPVVRDIQASQSDGSVEFSWSDPGLEPGDRYQIDVRDGSSSFQTSTRFVVAGTAGETVCLTVTVNRAGARGASSPERCVDVAGG